MAELAMLADRQRRA